MTGYHSAGRYLLPEALMVVGSDSRARFVVDDNDRVVSDELGTKASYGIDYNTGNFSFVTWSGTWAKLSGSYGLKVTAFDGTTYPIANEVVSIADYQAAEEPQRSLTFEW